MDLNRCRNARRLRSGLLTTIETEVGTDTVAHREHIGTHSEFMKTFTLRTCKGVFAYVLLSKNVASTSREN